MLTQYPHIYCRCNGLIVCLARMPKTTPNADGTPLHLQQTATVSPHSTSDRYGSASGPAELHSTNAVYSIFTAPRLPPSHTPTHTLTLPRHRTSCHSLRHSYSWGGVVEGRTHWHRLPDPMCGRSTPLPPTNCSQKCTTMGEGTFVTRASEKRAFVINCRRLSSVQSHRESL